MSHLGNLRSKNPKNIIHSYININSIRNKFENLCDIVGNNVHVLSMQTQNLTLRFRITILITWISWAFQSDINHRSGGLLIHIKAPLPSEILSKFRLPINIQMIPFEINLRNKKWLIVGVYKPQSQSNQHFLDILGDLTDFYLKDYDNNVILRF